MVITLDPIALHLGGIAIRWFGILAVLGLVLGLWAAARELVASGSRIGPLLDAACWAIPVGMLSARLLHLIQSWDFYLIHPNEIWQVSLSGLSLWGGLVGGGIAAARTLSRDPLARLRVADAVAVGLAVGIAVGRVGSFLNGDGQGIPTTVPWGTQYVSENASVPDFGVSRHPVQIYDGLVALALLALLVAVRTRLPHGARFWLFLGLYGATRVAMAPLRLEPPFLFGLQTDAILALAASAFALVQVLRVILGALLPSRHQPSPSTPPAVP